MKIAPIDGLLFVSMMVTFRGQSRLIDHLVLDTGASHSVISMELVDNIGIYGDVKALPSLAWPHAVNHGSKTRKRDTPMTENEIFTRALSLGSGWQVYDVAFHPEDKKLRIYVQTVRGSRHSCGTCGKADCRVYDHGEEREWRHINFFQYQAVIVGKPPRVRCEVCNKPKTAELSWARERSGFSLRSFT